MKSFFKSKLHVVTTVSLLILISSNIEAQNYPNYNTSPLAPDTTGMQSNAVQLASKFRLGWNIGNTLEATGGETAWGNPMVTKELIDLVKKNGFNAIRIPCAWNIHLSDTNTAKIDASWIKRVKEVVDYCIQDDMYVMLNIHWDGGWLENHNTSNYQAKNNAKQKVLWEQIATYFRNYDEHLMFATTNEPNVENAEQMQVLLSYHQTGIDAIRSTGGKNAYRCIVIQGPSTDIEKTYKFMHTMPTDKVPNRLMAEIHYYTPYQFCGLDKDADWGKMAYYWGKDYHSKTDSLHNATWGEEDVAVKCFKMMKEQFVDKGIPVLMGEYGAIRRSNLTGDDLSRHLASRAFWLKYITKTALDNGVIPFFWDAGGSGANSWGLFNRATNKISDYQGLNAIIQGAK
jgi:endoglucanase